SPATLAGESAHGGTSMLELAHGQTVRALVVDDVEENRRVLASMLAMVGCDVDLAEGGDEALSKMRAASFDSVFIDILMPVLNGGDALKNSPKRSRRRRSFCAGAFADTIWNRFWTHFPACRRKRLTPPPARSVFHSDERTIGIGTRRSDPDRRRHPGQPRFAR